VLKERVISGTQEITEIALDEVPDDFECGAVFVNQGEHAYSKVRFDADSIDWITDNLDKVQSGEDRGAIWRHFWNLVID
jgi:aminopeptidase N